MREHEAAGRVADAAEARRQLSRIRGLGFTAKSLDDSYTRAARFALREQNAGYVSLGAGIALAFGPQVWDLWHSQSLTDQAAFRTAHAGSVIAAERMTTYALSRNAGSILASESLNASVVSKLGSGSLRGSLQGNAIVGAAILATDTAFSVYEHGGMRAFKNENFLTNLGGGLGALPLAMGAGGKASQLVTLWTKNPIYGGAAGVVTGIAAGSVGYFGGRTATHRILENVNPEFMHREEDAAIADAIKQLSQAIAQTRENRI